MIGLNVGSGQRKFKSGEGFKWVNVDSVSRPGHEPDLLCDGSNLPYGDNTIDYFVLHHVMEHFGCGEAKHLIVEANRVLKPGGSLLIFLPDLKALATRWLLGGIEDYIYVVNLMGAYIDNEADRHKWHYTPETLIHALRSVATWKLILPFDWREIPNGDFARDWWLYAYEAVK